MRLKRSKRVVLGAGFLATVLALAGCSEEPSEEPTEEEYYDELCVERETFIRVEDQVCEDGGHSGSHGFIYVPYTAGSSQPKYPVGSKVTGGSFTKPGGGTFLRGGFGGVKGGSGG